MTTPYFNSLPKTTQDRLRPLLPRIVAAAQREGVSPDIMLSLIQEESSGRANALGDKGMKAPAKGMYQVRDTAFWLGGADPFDPAAATDAISPRVAQLARECNGDPACVHFKYNAGPGQKYTPQNVAAITAKYPHLQERMQRVAARLGTSLPPLPSTPSAAPVPTAAYAVEAPAFDPLAAPMAAARGAPKAVPVVDPLGALWGELTAPAQQRRGRVNSDPIIAMLGLS